jgi:hypothetical protein
MIFVTVYEACVADTMVFMARLRKIGWERFEQVFGLF